MTSAKSSPYHTLAISLIRSFCSDLELYHTFNTFKVELAAYDGLEEEQLEILRTHEIQDRLGLNPQKGVPYLETVIGFLCNHLGYDGDHDREDMKRTIAAAPRGRSVETSRKGRSLSTTRMGTRSTSRSQTRQREESEDERLAISVPRHRPKAGTVGTAVMAARSSAGRGQEAKEEDIKIVGARIRSDVPAVTKSGSVVGEAKKMRAEAANLSGTSETTYEPRIGRSAVRRDDVKKGNVVPVVNELRPVMSIGSSSRRDPSVDRSRNARERNSKSIASKHESRPGTTGATLTQSSDWPEVGRNGHSGGSGLVKVNSLTSMNRFPPSPVSTGISLRPLDGFDEPSMGRSRSRPDPRTVKFERQDQDMQPAYEASHKSASQPTRPGTSHRSKNDIYVTDTVTGTPRSDAQGKDAGSRSSNRNVLYEFGRQDQDIQSVHKASHKTAPQPTRPVSSQRSHSKTDIEITDTLTGTPNSLSQVKDAGLRSPNRSVLGELGRQEQDAQPVYKSSYTAARQPSRPVTSHGSHSKNDIEITDTFTDESDSETYLSASITKLTVNHLPSLPSTYPKPLPTELAQTVHNLIWGSQRPSPAWLTARLTLNRDPVLGYGLVQEKGGPCGVLAGLQGRLIKCLLEKSGGKGRNGWAKRDCEEALVRAVAECLWKARGDVEGRVIVGIPPHPTLPPSPLSLTLHTLTTLPDLTAFISRHLPSISLLPLLYSLVLTNTPAHLQSAMDDASTPLIAAHGYCTQDLVNLVLTGKALSNVFDGTKTMGETVMKGINEVVEIGFLSLFEAFGVLEVGRYCKNPTYPIWVIHSESHYTTLFAPTRDFNVRNPPKSFELVYYDGLANQDSEIRLKVTRGMGIVDEDTDMNLIPPLERCIRTVWKGAKVEWVEGEPIL